MHCYNHHPLSERLNHQQQQYNLLLYFLQHNFQANNQLKQKKDYVLPVVNNSLNGRQIGKSQTKIQKNVKKSIKYD